MSQLYSYIRDAPYLSSKNIPAFTTTSGIVVTPAPTNGAYFLPTVVVTVVRGQKHLMVGYVAIALVAKILSHHFVSLYGIMGAVELYTGLMTLLALVFAIVLILCVKKRKK